MSIALCNRIVLPSALAVLSAVAGGCVSAETHEMLRAAHAKLLEENKDLLADNAHLKGLLAGRTRDQQAAEADRARLEAERLRLEAELRKAHEDLARARTELDSTRNNSVAADQLDAHRRRIAELEGRLRDLAATPAAPPPPPAGPLADKPDVNEMVKRIAREHGLTYDERTGMLRFPADLLFPSGQDTLLGGADAPLRKLAAIIDHPQIRDFNIRIVGHTDKRPISRAETATRFPTNWHLSTARAIAVMAELIRHMGQGKPHAEVERLKDRFEPGGRGQRDLLSKGDGDADHRRNRRVEVFFVPPGRFAVPAAGGPAE
jgi:chemotaxis protein MotB